MEQRRKILLATFLTVGAVVSVVFLLLPPKSLVQSSRDFMQAGTSGDVRAIVASVSEDDLEACRLTREQWTKIAGQVIVPVTTQWRAEKLVLESLYNQKTMGLAYYQMENGAGKQVQLGMPAFATGERPITTVSYWLAAAFILEGAARSKPDTSPRPDLVYRKAGYQALRTKLKELGFTGYMELDGKFVEAP